MHECIQCGSRGHTINECTLYRDIDKALKKDAALLANFVAGEKRVYPFTSKYWEIHGAAKRILQNWQPRKADENGK